MKQLFGDSTPIPSTLFKPYGHKTFWLNITASLQKKYLGMGIKLNGYETLVPWKEQHGIIIDAQSYLLGWATAQTLN